MAESSNTYPSDPRAQVHRKKHRGAYDYTTIHSILRTAPIMHVGFAPTSTDPFPTVLPMIGAVGRFDAASGGAGPADGPQDIYLHGYSTARLFTKAHDATVLDDDGLPVCVCATSVDGLVMALTPFNHSMNYRSAVVHGYAQPVTDAAEKLWAMELVTDAVCTQRWENSRVPPTSAELTSTGILRVAVVSASAKVRAEGAGDDRADTQRPELRERIWTGVVPATFTLGEPVPAMENKIAVPAYLKDYIREHNERNQKGALEAARQKD